jgi:acyl-CoA synthetase (AMP-forming)/AMP-acid ligase II
MLDAVALIDKHRSKGVLVDTNLLVLFLIGLVNKRRILSFKRTQDFTIEDFDPLSRLIYWFGKLVTTPHVLSQVSDLTESHEEGKMLVSHPLFSRLGLADAAIATVCTRGTLVLTTDFKPAISPSATWSGRVELQSCQAPGMDLAR